MTQLPPNFGNENQVTETLVRDKAGLPILVALWAVLYLTQPDGSIVELRRTETIQLTDGFEWHAGMMSTRPPIFIGVCERCRYPAFRFFGSGEPTHGLTRISQLVTCRGCGIPCCRHRHAVHCSDGKWRCLPCSKSFARRRLLKQFVRFLFFKEVK